MLLGTPAREGRPFRNETGHTCAQPLSQAREGLRQRYVLYAGTGITPLILIPVRFCGVPQQYVCAAEDEGA